MNFKTNRKQSCSSYVTYYYMYNVKKGQSYKSKQHERKSYT